MGNREGRKRTRLGAEQLSEFFRQIAVMTGCGITLPQAMEILKTGAESSRFCHIYADLKRQMEQGSPASSAMEKSGLFPEMAVNMFRAGEASGRIREISEKMAVHYQKQHRMDSRIKTALLYPKILGFTALFSILLIFFVVFPTIEPLIKGMELPLITRVLMAFSLFVKERWYLAAVLFVAPSFIWRILLRSENIRCRRDGIRLKIPFVGRLLRTIYTFRFARSQSSLYSSGIPMLESLDIAGRTVGNRYVEKQFEMVIRRVHNGEMLSSAIKATDGFDKKLARIIYIGEETGKLDVVLENTADSYEQEADTALLKLVSMVEPGMILVMGLMIGLILIGIMVPLWNMYGYLG